MGFIEKEDGQLNKHQWNWPETGGQLVPVKAFHIETKEDADRKRFQGQSQQALTHSPYATPDQRGGSQLRSGSLYSQPKPRPETVHTKKYTNLKFCEANMIMYLNSLKMGLFDSDNPVLQDAFSKIPNLSDSQLSDIYDLLTSTYNTRSYDPSDENFVDGNGQPYTHKFKTISDSKASPEMPSLADFTSLYKASGAPALFSELMSKRGF
jgi:hypothetical protein